MLVTRNFDVFFDLRMKKCCANNREAGDLRRHRAHYDFPLMFILLPDTSDLECCFNVLFSYRAASFVSYRTGLKMHQNLRHHRAHYDVTVIRMISLAPRQYDCSSEREATPINGVFRTYMQPQNTGNKQSCLYHIEYIAPSMATSLTLHMVNFSEETLTCIYILYHSSALTWP